MPVKTVQVLPSDPGWPDAFQKEREGLLSVFGDEAVAVRHVGSTSVPGLAAKPVLDILVEVPSLGLVDSLTPSLEARGYEARGEYGIPGRRYFVRPAMGGPKVHLHVFTAGHPHAAQHLLFRDFLRAHPEDAGEYGRLKSRLARKHATDRDAYQRAKSTFVEALLERAGGWRRESRR